MIDLNGNGKIDPIDIGISAGMIDSDDDSEIEFSEEIDSKCHPTERPHISIGFLSKLLEFFK